MKESTKNVFKKIGEFLAAIFGTIFFGFTASYLTSKDKQTKEVIENKANEIKEETKDEIEKTDAADIVADSPNQSAISTTIDNEKSDLRERIRNRLK